MGDRAATPDPIPTLPVRDIPLSERTLPALLRRQGQALGDRPLLRFGTEARSYAEMPDAVARAAGTLADAGVAPGERVAIMGENRIEVLDLILGCAWLGAIAVPINTAARGQQLEHVLTNSGARVLALESDLVEGLQHVPPPSTLEAVWAFDGAPTTGPRGYRVSPAPPSAATPHPGAAVAPGDTAAILYTSGTTGVSKGVCCPQAQLYWFGVLVAEKLGLREDDVLHTTLPLFHVNALSTFVQALVTGATCVFAPRFSVSRFWRRLRAADATVTYLLGVMVTRLLAQPPGPGDRDHSVRVALSPGTPPDAARAFEERFGTALVEGYASTETNSVMGALPGAGRRGSMGFLRRGFEARVADEDGAAVPAGQPGELLLRPDEPYSFAAGYFRMPDRTVEAWRDLWFHTGDRVIRDADGWFWFVDRVKDAMRRNGENVSAYEVEQAVLGHPAVASAAAFAIPSADGEDEIAVAVVPRSEMELDPLEVIRHCEPQLAYFAIPRYVEVLPELPVTETGKVRKAELRERGVSASTWDRVASGYEPPRRP